MEHSNFKSVKASRIGKTGITLEYTDFTYHVGVDGSLMFFTEINGKVQQYEISPQATRNMINEIHGQVSLKQTSQHMHDRTGDPDYSERDSNGEPITETR